MIGTPEEKSLMTLRENRDSDGADCWCENVLLECLHGSWTCIGL